ncbi:MAG: hypothetical protein ACOH1P_03600 [Lysobacter sp.]
MNAPSPMSHVRPISPSKVDLRTVLLLATAIGLTAAMGMVRSAPQAAAGPAAQDPTTDQLDAMEKEVMPPPVNTTDVEHDQPWSPLDTDGDGRISRGEGDVDPDFSANFDMVDRNQDGYINRAEMDARDAVEDTPEPEEQDQY